MSILSAEIVRVMTYNLWIGGEAGRQPLERSAEVIRAARADVVGLQETAGVEVGGLRSDNGTGLAALLGWNHVDQGSRTAVITRFLIVEVTPRRCGIRMELPSGRQFFSFNTHLNDAPYQPYQLLGIRYSDDPFIATAEEAVRHARAARGAQIENLLLEVRPALLRGPVFLTGDFNEPSHLDWTVAAAVAGKCPLAVEWPTSRAAAAAGLSDTFRAVRPDEIGDRGDTWTPTTNTDDPKDRHDRIDFVFAGGAGVRILGAQIIGEDARRADVVVRPYPSDHRAVVAAVELPPLRGS